VLDDEAGIEPVDTLSSPAPGGAPREDHPGNLAPTGSQRCFPKGERFGMAQKSRARGIQGTCKRSTGVSSGLLRNWRDKIKAPDLCAWLGANRSDSRSYREDEQQRQGHKDKRSCSVNCEADH
jgi:hypothetical protein